MTRTELLSPAGSLDAAKAAVTAGADAIYMGGSDYSARAYALTAGTDMLGEAIPYCHLRGVRVYLTLNTLMKERETETLYAYLLPYVRAGLDGVIVQDLGVLRFLRETFPMLPIHLSTQMTITSRYGAELFRKRGASRAVLARELSLSEIRAIHDSVPIELECFVHGALCYAYSGQCLLSSMLGGRSGNRGRCAGPCRLPYEVLDGNPSSLTRNGGAYVLSMKDFDTHARLAELVAAGAMSLKIEGRMKSPLYVAAVTAVYRDILDRLLTGKGPEATAEENRILAASFDRGGSTDGYLDRHNGADMVVCREKDTHPRDEILLENLRERFLLRERKIPVRIEAVFRKGEPARLILSCGSAGEPDEGGLLPAETANGVLPVRVSALGEGEALSVSCASVYEGRSVLVSEAKTRPVSPERIRESLLKLGESPFYAEAITLSADPDIFFPIGEINELRRKAVHELIETILNCSRRDL